MFPSCAARSCGKQELLCHKTEDTLDELLGLFMFTIVVCLEFKARPAGDLPSGELPLLLSDAAATSYSRTAVSLHRAKLQECPGVI